MGAGPRLTARLHVGLLFGINFTTFPYAVSISIFVGPLIIEIGLGKPYTE